MQEPSTSFILDQLTHVKTADQGIDYINKNIEPISVKSFPEFYNTYIQNHPGLQTSDVVAASTLARTYAYEVLNGKKKGSRDKIIALCYSCQMSLDDINRGLKLSQNSPLYSKNNRDAAIILAITLRDNGSKELSTVIGLNNFLTNNGYEALVTSKDK